MAGDDLQNLLKSGIQAARSGNKAVARGIFEQVIRLDAQNELAWMWMASVLESNEDRQRALQRVLSINPNNTRAQQALQKLGGTPPRGTAPLRPPEDAADVSPTGTAPEAALRAEADRQAAPPRRRSRGVGATLFYTGVLIAIVAIGVGLFLGIQELDTSLQPDTPVPVLQAPPTVVATTVPPTPTPVPARTFAPGVFVAEDNLPPTWTPVPSSTPLPTATEVVETTNLEEVSILFAGADSPAALRQLMVIQASGVDLRPLNVQLDPENLEVIQPATATPTPEDVTPAEAEATPTEASDSASEPAAGASGAQQSGLFEGLEFLDPAVSPNGRFVAFTAQVSPNVQEIFMLTVDSNAVRQLTTLVGSVTDGATWSPSGREIAFSSNGDGSGATETFDIFLVNIDTGELSNLTNGIGQNREPTWSPDGNRIVFSSDRSTPGELEIWSLTIGSGVAEQLTDAVNGSFSPAFSHDGTRIAFISNRGGDNDVYVMNADGTDERLISLNDQGWDDRDPAWLPNDDWIVLSSNRDDSRVLQLWLVRPDGSEWRKITDQRGTSRFAVWLPSFE